MDEPLTIDPPVDSSANQPKDLPDRIIDWLIGRIPGLRGSAASERLRVAFRGSALTSMGYGASQVLKVASTLILARLLLDPQAFGLMALVNVFLTGLEVLSDLGIGLDVVQHPRGDDEVFLDTAFFMQIGRSLLLCAIAAAIAVPFANFYHQPEVRWLALVGAMSVGIRGFASMSIWTMTRRVEMGKLSIVSVIGDFVGVVCAIGWAAVSPTAWALVAGKIATALAYVIASHFFSERMPRFRWDSKAARDLLLFGGGIFLSSATYFFSTQAERLVIGKFATVAELGCFALAMNMAYAPYGITSRVIMNVFYPMFSNTLRQNPDKLESDYKKFRMVFLVPSLVMSVGFITLSYWVVAHLLRPQYAPTAWMLQLLGVRAAMELFGSAGTAMLLSAGLARENAMGHTVKFVLAGAGLAIAFGFFGLREAMWVLAVSPGFHYLTILFPLHKRFRFVLRTEIVCILAFTAVTLLTAFGYHAIVVR